MSRAAAVGAFIDRIARHVVLVSVVLTVVAAFGLTRLDFETSQESLIDPSSEAAGQNARFQEEFGGDPMVVLLTGDVDGLLTGRGLADIDELENALRATGQFHAVVGPATALRFAARQLEVAPAMFGRARASAADPAAIDAALLAEATRLSTAGEQQVGNPSFGQFLLYDGDGAIRSAMRDAFVDDRHAQIIVRLEGNASIAEQGEAADLVKRLVTEHPVTGFTALATGPAVLLQEINDYLQGGMASLGALAAGVMVAVLFVVFRGRWRLLSLAVVALGLVWAFGLLGFLGIPLTMVTISGLPILLGLGVDFAIQLHARFEQEMAAHDGRTAARRTLGALAGPLSVAMVAAAFGFLALQLSAVPMIRDFGVMLSTGVVVLVAAALLIVPTALARGEDIRPRHATRSAGRERHTERVVRRTMTSLLRVPSAVLVAAVLALGTAGLVVEGSGPIETDPERWVSSGSDAVGELVQLRAGTQSSSEVSLLIEADDVTAPAIVAWMARYADRQLTRHPDELVGATSLPSIAKAVTGAEPAGADVEALAGVAPADVRSMLISADRTRAAMIFPIAPISLDAREGLLDDMIADVDAPSGVAVSPAGLAVVGVELVGALQANRQLMSVAALGLVAAWLFVVHRRVRRVLVVLAPVVLATGVASLVIRASAIALTPLTTVATPLVIAMATEFSVLVVARYLEERLEGASPSGALEQGCTAIARAFVASGATLLGGFAVLMLSPLPLLFDFGLVVAMSVLVALISVLLVLPPVLLRADRAGHFTGLSGPQAGADTDMEIKEAA